jgi:hypothetical protein
MSKLLKIVCDVCGKVANGDLDKWPLLEYIEGGNDYYVNPGPRSRDNATMMVQPNTNKLPPPIQLDICGDACLQTAIARVRDTGNHNITPKMSCDRV